jgi:hypothetical protein
MVWPVWCRGPGPHCQSFVRATRPGQPLWRHRTPTRLLGLYDESDTAFIAYLETHRTWLLSSAQPRLRPGLSTANAVRRA